MKCENIGCRYNIDKKCFCKENTLPFISCRKNKKESVGKVTERRTGLLNKEIKAYNYYLKGKSFSWISTKLKVSKSTAHGYVKKLKGIYKDNKGVIKSNDKGIVKKPNAFKRLHNDVVSFLIEPISFWGEPNIVRLKYTSYLLVKEEKFHVQIFEGKLVVRFLEDIVCKSIGECRDRGVIRIKDFLKSFSYKGVRFKDDCFEQVSRHYAIIGSDIAKKVIKEKKKFFVFDKGDGRRRAVVDLSLGKDRPEFELEHPVKGFEDGVNSEKYFEVMLDNPNKFDDPVTTKNKIDMLQSDYIDSVKDATNMMRWMAENNKSHKRVLEEMSKTLKEIQKSLNVK